MIKVIHTVPSIAEEASGPSYSVVRLCQALRQRGASPTLAVLEGNNESSQPDFITSFPRAAFPRSLGRSPAMYRWLKNAVAQESVSVVHNHSLWMMPNVYPGLATRGTKVPLIVAPRGTLTPWALERSKWKKKAFWRLLQKRSIDQAACFHVTSEAEYLDLRRVGFKQPACIIPNGIDLPVFRTSSPADGVKRLLFLGRIHPKKGVDTLLQAWARVFARYPNWELHIVGPDNDGYLDKMRQLSSQLQLRQLFFRGPIYGEEKLEVYRAADLFVLPTRSENFGMTVAESLAAGTPAIVTKGAPWAGLEKCSAGWWIDIGVDPLVACLEQALCLSKSELKMKGAAGRRWMREDFSWDMVAGRMMDTYRWVTGDGPRPDCVRN